MPTVVVIMVLILLFHQADLVPADTAAPGHVKQMRDMHDFCEQAGVNMEHRKRYIVAVIASMTLIITYLHYSTNTVIHSQHELYRELYYLPVLLGAVAFGLNGALATYLAVLALYLPYVLRNWTGDFAIETNRILHLILQGSISVIAGLLIDRDRRRRTELEKERYLAGIGRAATAILHDVKSPLVAIRGFAQRLKQGKGKIDVAADAIIGSAGYIESVAHDVLDFARPLDLNLRDEDLRTVIDRAYAVSKSVAEAAGVELTLDLPLHPIIGPLDSVRLERAIINLMNNAIEASKRDQIVSVSTVTGDSRSAITIRDSGPGMDAETLENLFVPFFTKKNRGTGIGMTIAKRIIEGHNGSLTIKSRPGFGTEISVQLAVSRKA